MTSKNADRELIVSRQILSIPQRFATGPVMGRFLSELRDNKRIVANHCPQCGRHLVPPREVCAICHAEGIGWEELGPEGTIRDFDVVYYASPDPLTGETRGVPYVVCWVDLDGTKGDAPFWHLLDAPDPAKVRKGLRVRVVFADETSGSMEDIEHFEIVDSEIGDSHLFGGAVSHAMGPNGPPNRWLSPISPAFVIEGKMALPYQYLAGATSSEFIVALRNEKKIRGVRCDRCDIVFVPPRRTCDRCFADLSENWVDIASTGEVTGFTVIRYREPYQPKEPPYVLALIKLDGADTPIAHILDCRTPENARIGMRVHAVFADEPVGSLLAIQHFTPL